MTIVMVWGQQEAVQWISTVSAFNGMALNGVHCAKKLFTHQ